MVNSIDCPVDKLCIVQNGVDDTVEDSIKSIYTNKNPFVNKVYLDRPFRNMGVGPSWNMIIKSFPECDYWLIANNDTIFLPGDLKKYHDAILTNPQAIILDSNSGFGGFIVTPYIISQVGLFDENIWPMYHEDIDYIERIKRVNIERISIDSQRYDDSHHSQTIKSNESYRQSNQQTQWMSGVYMDEKWGPGYSFSQPWNHPTRFVSDWLYDPNRRKIYSQIWNDFEQTSNRIDSNKS
jgi:hypothetical protein